MAEPVSAQNLFKGRHFDQEIIVLCVRWYLTFKLEFPRPGPDDGRTGHRFGPHDHLALSCSITSRSLRSAGIPIPCPWATPGAWTRAYLKVKGQWVYLYRVVDKAGRTVDFFLSKTRDLAAAKGLLKNKLYNSCFGALELSGGTGRQGVVPVGMDGVPPKL
jgi:DDE domain